LFARATATTLYGFFASSSAAHRVGHIASAAEAEDSMRADD
jgi:hypothetical protein